jgi:hypothetical protein
MRHRASLSRIVLATVVAGAALGGFSGCTPKGTRAIVVGPSAATLNYKKVALSKEMGDIAFWASKEKNRHLKIEFEDQIFEGMTPVGSRYRVNCSGRTCFSGEIRESTQYGLYKYWQILEGPDGQNKDEKDGWIIIQK